MTKPHTKLIVFLIVVLVTSALAMAPHASVAPAYAACPHGYETYSDHKINGGVGNYGSYQRPYWIAPSITQSYPHWSTTFTNAGVSYGGGYIGATVRDWNNTLNDIGIATPVSINKVTSESASVYRFHNLSLAGTTIGKTYWKSWTSKPNVTPTNSNWDWAIIYLDCAYMSGHVTDAQAKGTSGHELGHAMGLAHRNSTPGSLMCQIQHGRVVNTPRSHECDTINHLY
jgi:hypothetical protein